MAETADEISLPKLVYDFNTMPEIWKNIYIATKHFGLPSVLTRTNTATKRANRSSLLRDWDYSTGLSPDEYPFASTAEGGKTNGARLRGVSNAEQHL